ncbi:hypothetical protein S40285_03978 [Stachybotrys chlorohalonatus IBT 40285]|uniref:Xylanolytic transcriptional activator regulatory domain-containing protein n=1 Tax=Stachybotrys chlorohalonatus (strain IBT 40285) TaxID=1283841 RepID=A0A084QC70_STAC4|nr:hypothetical protein S40285_03978 [Stachybotrys chlorohalonata IBT 40285]
MLGHVLKRSGTYPCNHCTRRRRPEECVFGSNPADAAAPLRTAALSSLDEIPARRLDIVDAPSGAPRPSGRGSSTASAPAAAVGNNKPIDSLSTTLAQSFGYFDGSPHNTMALLREWDLRDEVGKADVTAKPASPDILAVVKRDLARIPHRQILDFLVQYFVRELNWMKQIVHSPVFLSHYQHQWTVELPLSVEHIEFTTLVLRICSYTAQFLPSPSYTVDTIHGLSLSEIRDTCDNIGNSLAKACLALDWKGSLVRVQHHLFASLKSSCEGRTDQFWEGVACASQAAQKAGIHTDIDGPGAGGIDELEKEMRRRTFCTLYMLDSHLSRQLDRLPFLPDDSICNMLPRVRLGPNLGDMDPDNSAPEIFTERLMQLHLGRFWRKYAPIRNLEYDPTHGEQRYERFCTEYLPLLAPSMALKPDTKWDKHVPKLALQRELLHISILDSICWSFRPLLLLKPRQIANMPPYKRVLLQSQREKLALAALKELEAVTALHSMLGGSHTRFAAIIFNTFEAAVTLLSVCSHPDFSTDQVGGFDEILGLKVPRPTRQKSLLAVEKALGRLQMLSGVSEMAASGASIIVQLYIKATRESVSPDSALYSDSTNTYTSWPSATPTFLGSNDELGPWGLLEPSNPEWMAEVLSAMASNADPFAEVHLRPQLDLSMP